MKHRIGRTIAILTLALALILGAMALAEGADVTEPETPAAESAEAEDSTALQDALDAYNSARESSRADELEAELKEYVAAGKLTQEQADLILGYYKEQQALRDGVCPNCGYEFQTSGGRGMGGRMGKGGHGRGGMGGMYGAPQRYAAGEDAVGAVEAPLQENVL